MDNKSITQINCEQADMLLNEYIDGELDAVTVAALEAHLAECDSCRREYEQLRELCCAVGDAAEVAPPELHGRIMAAVRAEAGAARRRRFISRFGAGIAALLCFGVIATAAVRQMSSVDDLPSSDGRMANVGEETDAVGYSLPHDIVAHAADDRTQEQTPVYSSDGENAEAIMSQPKAEDIIGAWQTDSWELSLNEDGSFELSCVSGQISGQYCLEDGRLSLRYDDKAAVYDCEISGGRVIFTHVSGEQLLS